MRIKIMIDIIKFLVRGVRIAAVGSWKWVKVKDIRFFNFYYICGVIGYFEKEFFKFDDVVFILVLNEYELWLRVLSVRFRF